MIKLSMRNLENKKKDDIQTIQAKYGKDHIQVKNFIIKQEKEAQRFKDVGPFATMNDGNKLESYITEMLDKRNRLEIEIGELKEKQSFFGEQLRDLDAK